MGSALDSKGKLKSLNVTQKINNLIKKAENDAILEGKNGKYAASKLYNIIYPVVGVGARILDVVVQSNPVWFGKNLLGAYYDNAQVKKAIKDMSANEADMVFRQLKEGTIGTAAWMLGYFIAKSMLDDDDNKHKSNKVKLRGFYTGFLGRKDRKLENLPSSS